MTPDRLTLLVTDSGLGGLSVYADLVEGLTKASPCPKVSLIYFNAWPEEDRGYNHYPDMDYKARVFQNAMEAMAGFQPQQILIACNTLSVIYEHTPFAQANPVPVTGIVDMGVTQIRQALEADPDAGVIVLGTPTTADSAVHAQALIRQGIAPERIFNQGCFNLAGNIERRPFSGQVDEMIAKNAESAAQQIRERGKAFSKLYLALCCTHFGYRAEAFVHAVEAATHTPAAILNPNQAMAKQALATDQNPGPAQVELSIFSRVTWEQERLDAYEKLFAARSPRTVEALKTYTLNPELFRIT